jgi:hypothetical protein
MSGWQWLEAGAMAAVAARQIFLLRRGVSGMRMWAAWILVWIALVGFGRDFLVGPHTLASHALGWVFVSCLLAAIVLRTPWRSLGPWI